MKILGLAMAVGVLVWATAGRADDGLARGNPEFTDAFTAKESFPERWLPLGDAASRVRADTGLMAVESLGLVSEVLCKVPLKDSCWIEGTLAYREAGTGDRWIGFRLDESLFILRAEGFSWLVPDPALGKVNDVGKSVAIPDWKIGRSVKFAIARRVSGPVAHYAFFVDGKPAGELDGPKPKPQSRFVFRVWNARATLDDFGVFALKSSDSSPNLVINGDCEHELNGYPAYYNRYDWFPFGKLPLEKFDSLYLPSYGFDRTVAHSGTKSIRVDLNEAARAPTVWPWGAGAVKGEPGVFSVWMKSTEEALGVKLVYMDAEAEVKVGREWARYWVKNPSLGAKGVYSPVQVKVLPRAENTPATLWLDDFQAEIGTEPTPFRPSDVDKSMFAAKQTVVRRVIEVPALPKEAKRPDADLDAWRGNAAEVKDLRFSKRVPKNDTRVYLACDREAMYVGFRAFGEDPANAAKPKPTTDVLSICSGDDVEFFFSPTRERKWHHLVAAANGSRADLFGEDVNWNGRWTLKTVVNAKAGATDYFLRIPATDFAARKMKDRFLANLCRSDAATSEPASLVDSSNLDYRQFDRWAELVFPSEIVAAWRALAPEESEAEAERPELVGRLNFYMNEPEAKFRVMKGEEILSEHAVPLATMPCGTNRVTVAGFPAEIVKLPYRKDATQINRFARCLEREGRKIYHFSKLESLAWMGSEEGVYGQTALYAYGGFRHVISMINICDERFGYIKRNVAAYDRAVVDCGLTDSRFVTYAAEIGDPAKVAQLRARNDRYRALFDGEGPLFSSVMDEPELVYKSEDCYRLLTRLRPFYPYRPMVVNNTHMGIPNNFARLETDILMLDDYLTECPGRTVADSLVNIDKCAVVGKRLHRPSYAYLVSANTPYQCREPSQAEVVAETYGALADGITGISYIGEHHSQTVGDWEGVKQMAREFTVLEPFVLSETPDPKVGLSADPAKVRSRCIRTTPDTLVAVNVDEGPVGAVTFTLPADRRDATKVKVLFEDREIAVTDGRFTDDFPALTRHVYQWEENER